MSNQYAPATEKIKIGAGTAFKAGFFGTLGVFVCAIIVYTILGIIALVLFAAGSLPFLSRYFN